MDSWRSRISERVDQLRKELSAEELPQYRTVDGNDYPWQKSPAGTDATLQRFIVARKGDVFAAKKQFIENLQWRSSVFPIPREGLTAKLLDEEVRFRSLRRDPDGCPILLVNFLFGEFETAEISQVALVLASIRFFEDTIDSMEEHGVHQISAIVFGSPPPVAWAHVMVKVFQNNYPERLKVAVVYPVPSSFAALVRQVMWFVDENTRSKVDMETDEQPLLCRFGYRSEDLPPEIQGGYIGVGERWKPDRRKILGLAYSFLLPHGRQVAQLEQDLVRSARKASASAPSPLARNGRELNDSFENDLSSWLFACCLQKPQGHSTENSPDEFLDPFEQVEEPEPVCDSQATNSTLSCLWWFGSFFCLALILLVFLLNTKQRISLEL
ncbi:unnamed protein product [Durusdinium trenchii]|uniref:Luminal-binding protein 5 n=2 Tax=Durusdinium trenchii TaxID=1381693 RepID=A0ABP0JP66_9DINO